MAVVDFARRWHASDVLMVTAASGTAAVQIGAQTYQRAIGMGWYSDANTPVSMTHLETWQPVGLLIIDEGGFISRRDLHFLNERLKKVKDCDMLFGGLHILFVGDHYQLQAIGGAVYKVRH